MALTRNQLDNLLGYIYVIKHINCIYKTQENESYISLEKHKLPKILKRKEQEVIQYFTGTTEKRQENMGYVFKNSMQLRYLGMAIYEEKQYVGHVILGPYTVEGKKGEDWLDEVIKTKPMADSEIKELVEIYKELPLLSIKEEIALINMIYALWQIKDETIRYIPPDAKHSIEVPQRSYELEVHEIDRVLIARHERAVKNLVYYVNQGDEKKALAALKELNMASVKRFGQDSIRNFKNLILTLNGALKISVQSELVDGVVLYHLTGEVAQKVEICGSTRELQHFLIELIKTYCKIINNAKSVGESTLIRNATQYIRFNFNEEINLKKIAQELFVHPNYLSRKFKEETGYQVSDYINKVRIEQAQLLLENEAMSITDVAYTVGYNDEKYFSRVFKKVHQKTPREYRSS